MQEERFDNLQRCECKKFN